jgi:hypothetical protein
MAEAVRDEHLALVRHPLELADLGIQSERNEVLRR